LSHFVIAESTVAGKPHPPTKRFSAGHNTFLRRFVTNAAVSVALLFGQPDSLRAGRPLRREHGR
jgi:hypothetical protein